MIVTMKELEKGIWCPDARARAIGGTRDQVANRVIDGKEIKADGKKIFCCIGPACMAWRWVEEHVSGFCGRAGMPYAEGYHPDKHPAAPGPVSDQSALQLEKKKEK